VPEPSLDYQAASPGRRLRRRCTSRFVFRLWCNHAVFVQTDNPLGNQVAAYDRAATDALAGATYGTGGIEGCSTGPPSTHCLAGIVGHDRPTPPSMRETPENTVWSFCAR